VIVPFSLMPLTRKIVNGTFSRRTVFRNRL